MTRLIAPLFSLSLVAAAGCADDSETIADLAQNSPELSVLAGALEATGLDETLSGDGPFTVFAPTDAAFDRLPPGALDGVDADTLARILTHHVVAGSFDAAAVTGLDSAQAVDGAQLGIAVADSAVVISGTTRVTTTDLIADNGVVHLVDSVLWPSDLTFPGDLVDAAIAYPTFDPLAGALTQAGLVDALRSDNGGNGFTVFAPQSRAFAAIESDIAGLTTEQLTDVLLYHVVGQQVEAQTVLGMSSAPTLQGEDITIAVDSGAVELNGNTTVVRVDLRTANGIVHVVDSVLLPPQ